MSVGFSARLATAGAVASRAGVVAERPWAMAAAAGTARTRANERMRMVAGRRRAAVE